MNTSLYPEFKELYEAYKQTDDYAERIEQYAIAEVNKEIIVETLKHEPLLNEHLTGLIQMFKFGVSDETFDKYIKHNIADKERRKEIAEKADQINKWRYTGAGLNAVTNLSSKELNTIKTFIKSAFTKKTIEEAVSLCEEFEKKEIPLVKSGIYSPWLFYINPTLFPILNNSHIVFRKWFGMPSDYPTCIRNFNELKELVNEPELGRLDMFAHNFNKYFKLKSGNQTLNLNGKKLYKISHGIFKKAARFKNAGVAAILVKNNWISLGKDTSKGQADEFRQHANIGDYVYVCYGGDDLYCIGKIISEVSPIDIETDKLMNGGGEWIYREIEPFYFPQIASIRELKSDTRFFMPSGNSTFYEVPKDELEYLNQSLFIPKFKLKIIDSTINKTSQNQNKSNSAKKVTSINSILYGPPGTGKTYHSISYAIAIVENKPVEQILKEEREIVKNLFDQYIKDGQIVFSTFHQSLGYEDFIEGIKPIEPISEDEQLNYAVEDGIFKRLCTEASFSFVQQNITAETEKVLDFSSEYEQFVDFVDERLSKGLIIELQTKSGGKVYIDSISEKNNIWIKHVDRCREYPVSKKRLSKIAQAYPDLSEVTNINDQFRAEIGGSNSSAYWAVLNAIRNHTNDIPQKKPKIISEKEYSYEDKKRIIDTLNNDDYKIQNLKQFVLIIDEINRGNISQVFGELITLIEDDKRLGSNEALKTILPYSKESFGVPCNLHIIGTMNTADRSIEALDTALRRRFSFINMEPEPEKLKVTDDGINLPEILRVMNNRLSVLKDNDHTIGHAWLWTVKNVDQLKEVFKNNILPLLKEYFYSDYEKLGLVLGDAFFKPHIQVNSRIFASFSGGNGLAPQYDQSWQYQLKPVDELTIEDFRTLEQQNIQPEADED